MLQRLGDRQQADGQLQPDQDHDQDVGEGRCHTDARIGETAMDQHRRADECGDAVYLDALSEALHRVKTTFDPQFIIYLAGADPHENDRLGKLSLSKEGMCKRDQQVYNWAAANALPVAIAMAGGYGKDINLTVEIHAQTILSALCLDQSLNHNAR